MKGLAVHESEVIYSEQTIAGRVFRGVVMVGLGYLTYWMWSMNPDVLLVAGFFGLGVLVIAWYVLHNKRLVVRGGLLRKELVVVGCVLYAEVYEPEQACAVRVQMKSRVSSHGGYERRHLVMLRLQDREVKLAVCLSSKEAHVLANRIAQYLKCPKT